MSATFVAQARRPLHKRNTPSVDMIETSALQVVRTGRGVLCEVKGHVEKV